MIATRRSAVAVSVEDDKADSGVKDVSAGLTAQLYPLLRSDQVVQLNFTLTLDPKAASDWDMYNSWGEPGSLDVTISEVQLWDRKNGKIYHPGQDKSERCLCSSRAQLAPGQTVVLTAAFAAPPADVDQLTVSMPTFGAFNDVPIQ